jgi:hypothetical protein
MPTVGGAHRIDLAGHGSMGRRNEHIQGNIQSCPTRITSRSSTSSAFT